MLDSNLAKLETLLLRSVLGSTWLPRAKDIVFSVLAPGPQNLPGDASALQAHHLVGAGGTMPGCDPDLCAGNLGIRAPTPSPWPCGLVALHSRYPTNGWRCWDVARQLEPLHMIEESMRAIQHRVRKALHLARYFLGAGRWCGRRGLPRGAPRNLHREAALVATGAVVMGLVDLGACARAQATDGFDLCALSHSSGREACQKSRHHKLSRLSWRAAMQREMVHIHMPPRTGLARGAHRTGPRPSGMH